MCTACQSEDKINLHQSLQTLNRINSKSSLQVPPTAQTTIVWRNAANSADSAGHCSPDLMLLIPQSKARSVQRGVRDTLYNHRFRPWVCAPAGYVRWSMKLKIWWIIPARCQRLRQSGKKHPNQRDDVCSWTLRYPSPMPSFQPAEENGSVHTSV